MAIIIARPTVRFDSDGYQSFWEAAIDGDPDKSYTLTSYGGCEGFCFYAGFDFSSMPSASTIKSIKAYIKASTDKNGNFSCQVVKNVQSRDSYTDAGDGSKYFVSGGKLSSSSYYSVSFPVAASSLSADSLKNGNVQVRAYVDIDAGFLASVKSVMYDFYLEVEYVPKITVTTQASPAGSGTVTGGGTYESGSTVTATATPNNGYKFSHWLINGANSSVTTPTISGVLTENTTVTAVFVKAEEPSKVYCGSKKVSVYCGTKKVSVYCGTVKIS